MINNTEIAGRIGSKYGNYPSGRYEKYENKIRKISEMLAFIKRHRVALAAGFASAIAVTLLFLFCIGIFIGNISCDDFTYGEAPAISANAFLSDVSFQFRDAGGSGNEGWSDAMPTKAGEYYIRAVSENAFGMKRYSQEAAFTLLERNLEIVILASTCTYGDLTETYLADKIEGIGLAEGDRVCDVTFDFTSKEWEKADVSIISYRVINADGIDVTKAYNTITRNSTLSVLARKITISTGSAEHEYSGTQWKDAQWELSEGTLAAGDRLEVAFPVFSGDAGEYTVAFDSYKITDQSGEDITYKYDITLKHGLLRILPRTLLFSTESAEKVYDETEVTNSEWKLLDGTLVNGHTLSAKTIGSQSIVGESENTLEVSVVDSNGKNVTSNYAINVQTGTLKIIPIVLKFTTESAEKVYDGLYWHVEGFEKIEGELLPSHRIFCETNGTQTNVGESDNTLFVVIYNSSGKEITSEGYKIEVACGKLKVTPRPITIESGSMQKKYDGMPLVWHQMSISSGSLANKDKTPIPSFTGSQTLVGESPNTFSVLITDSSDINMNANYQITYVYGTLKVTPAEDNQNEIDRGDTPGESGNNEFISNGGPGSSVKINTPRDVPDYTIARVKLLSESTSPFYAYLRAASYGKYNGSGFEAANEYKEQLQDKYISALDFIGRKASASENYNLSTLQVTRLSECPVLIPYYSLNTQKYFGQSDAYFLSDLSYYEYPFFQIPSLESVLAFENAISDYGHKIMYRDFVYSEYLQIPETTQKELLRIAEENGLGTSDDLYSLIVEIQKYIQTAAKYNLKADPYPEGVDVVVYFLDVAKEGICQHYAAAATMMYRAFGIPARYVTGFSLKLYPNTLHEVSTRDAHAWVEIYLDGIGWVPIEVTGSGRSSDEDTQDGRIELLISAYSASKEFDGMPFDTWEKDKFQIIEGQLLPGHTISVSIDESGLHRSAPGKYTITISNVVIRDENGKDVTNDLYRLSLMDGNMRIRKRKLVVQFGSANKVYDGTPLTCDNWWIANGSLPPGMILHFSNDSQLTDVGVIENGTDSISVIDLDSNTDLSRYFDITVLFGTLEVTQE